jgi:hypothetical protein
LKNTHLLRCAHPSSLRRTVKVRLIPHISRALHLNIFDQPVNTFPATPKKQSHDNENHHGFSYCAAKQIIYIFEPL